jgi:hypothetical protein
VPDQPRATNSARSQNRYPHLLAYDDASAYRERIEKVRNDFKDLKYK